MGNFVSNPKDCSGPCRTKFWHITKNQKNAATRACQLCEDKKLLSEGYNKLLKEGTNTYKADAGFSHSRRNRKTRKLKKSMKLKRKT